MHGATANFSLGAASLPAVFMGDTTSAPASRPALPCTRPAPACMQPQRTEPDGAEESRDSQRLRRRQPDECPVLWGRRWGETLHLLCAYMAHVHAAIVIHYQSLQCCDHLLPCTLILTHILTMTCKI